MICWLLLASIFYGLQIFLYWLQRTLIRTLRRNEASLQLIRRVFIEVSWWMQICLCCMMLFWPVSPTKCSWDIGVLEVRRPLAPLQVILVFSLSLELKKIFSWWNIAFLYHRRRSINIGIQIVVPSVPHTECFKRLLIYPQWTLTEWVQIQFVCLLDWHWFSHIVIGSCELFILVDAFLISFEAISYMNW